MECRCEGCDGSGYVVCPECDGSGSIKVNIETFRVYPGMRHEDKLRELKSDAERVRKQADELCAMKPEREEFYQGQLKACLKAIDGQANDLIQEGC
jgi:DnaJ-class molecular chaperone